MKKLILFLFCASLVNADVPHFGPNYDAQKTNLEFQNLYHDISSPQKSNILGVTTNSNASTGYVGEYISSWADLTFGPTTNQWGDLTSISLTAGDWDVSINLSGAFNASTVTNIAIGVGKTSGNNAPNITGQSGDDSVAIPFSSGAISTPAGSLAAVRVSLSSTTTIYYKMFAIYTGNQPEFRGRISARRVR